MRVDIWSDIVCPWCYIGKRRFERALATFDGRDAVEIVHRSFQLDPAVPRGETSSRREMLMQKYRLTDAQLDEMDARMTATAAAEGLEYHLDKTVTGNTFDAHQLLQFAGAQGRREALTERLYRAYFTEGRSVFDETSLVPLAVDIGLNEDDARAALREQRYAPAVEQDIMLARRLSITGVPFYVIDGKYGVSGAQSPEVFLDALQRAAA